ncbi:MAG: ABC transporter ATP-binding protein [Chloroflexi bacterium]|nr:ABC transporter ATP-binding protein [Chloroflexota bacterium]
MSLEFEATMTVGAFHYEAAFEARDEIVVLFGHSGAGKSLTLQAIAGLLRPQSGRIVIDGQPVVDTTRGIDLPPQRRHVGYVVQSLALFPHLTVAENVAFGMNGDRASRASRTARLLQALGLEGTGDRRPRTLSVGQQQRVALARALGREARLLLLDEPFSALDESLRTSLRSELLRLRAELGLSIVFVTHDLREAHLLADRLAVFDAGRVLQFGPREDVFRRPSSRRVAELTGVANIARGVVREADETSITVDVAGMALVCGAVPGLQAPSPGSAVDVTIRAERVNLRRFRGGGIPGTNTLEARIVEEYAYGSTHTLKFAPVGPGPALEVEIAARPYEVLGVAGQRDWLLELPPGDLHVMPAS